MLFRTANTYIYPMPASDASAASNVLIIRCVSGNGFVLGSQLVLCIGKLCANVSVEPWFSQDAPQTAVVSDNCAGLMCDTMCPMR